MLRHYSQPLAVDYKDKGKTDPVTEADRAVEAYLVEAVRARFPDHAVLGEEGHDPEGEHDFEWIVDPIDGTINFVNRLPFFAISIGVLHQGRPVVGVFHFPLTNETLHARRGGGAFRNGTPIQVHPATEPSGRVTIGIPPGYLFQFKTQRAGRRKLGEPRSLGSVVYEMGQVAIGGFGWAIFRSPKIWDVAGGITLITEAGGAALRYDGKAKAWLPLDHFAAPQPKDPNQPAKLRHWSAPVIVGARPLLDALAPTIAPRRMPVALTVAMQGYRGWRRWLPKKQAPPAQTEVAAEQSAATTEQPPKPD